MRPAIDKLLIAAAAAVLILLAANIGLMLRNTRQLREDAEWVAHTREVITGLENIFSLMKDAETGFRGYVITGDPRYLEPFDKASTGMDAQIKEVERLTSDNAEQQARFPRLRLLITDKLSFMESGRDLMKSEGFAASQRLILPGRGKLLMDELRELTTQMITQERELLKGRSARARKTYSLAMVSGLVSGLLAMVSVGGFLFVLRHLLRTRSAAAAAIAEQAERLRTTLASIGDAVIATDTEGKVTNLNAVAESLTGWSNDEAVGRPLESVFHIVNETTREVVESPVAKALREGVIVGLANHTVLIAKDGSERAISDSAAPIRCKAGGIVGCVLVFRDVSVERAADRALRTSEARKSAILTSALDCIISMDHEGRMVDFNPAAEQTFGFSRAEVLGRSVAETIIPAEYREAHVRGLAHFLATGEGPMLGRRIELSAQRADGRQFPCELAITMTRLPDQPPYFTAYLRDITEQKQAREDLRQAAERLAQADRSKDEFLAMLAHELRNPLAPMRNAVQLLEMADASDEERRKAQATLERQIENMGRMINDLLDVSRITEGKIELRKKPVRLEAVLTASTSLIRANLAAHGQELTVSMPDGPVYLDADATRLEQVFGNLLSNACKYSGDGSHIALRAARDSTVQPPEVTVTVSDDGIGITPELLPHVFDLFVQSTRSLDRSHGGLGIGLTLVQRLVALHGGRVEARSAGPGEGSEFTVHLPILSEAPPTPPPAPAMAKPAEVPRRILIVDDNTDSALTMAALQKRRGHETRTAFTGPDALIAAAEFQPDVILLDIGLPGMDGFEVARRLRAMPAFQKIQLIAMSGYGRAEDRALAQEAGFDEYLVKPIEHEVLREHLRKPSA
ncbi:MAG: PAS domain S-box protein [Verrucomicrobia bacterium]|nr:PAS domain S-box protein [Verrucomicrobiota bacterium]